jgi:mannose-1-phosphate guanylyltransferase
MQNQGLVAAPSSGTRGSGSHRWGVILAGGDGKRLLPLTRQLTGDDRPKQFCALTGGETLLDQTRRRARRSIPEDRTLILLTRTHERFYARQLENSGPSRLLVQPHNHGTAPAIAYSLSVLRDMDPKGTVAFFPSDHHFGDDQGFADCMESAFAQAAADTERVILLGIAPEAPEEAYGWIEPGAVLGDSVFEVRRFWEKPSRRLAVQLMRRGCLWNSFVMVGRVDAFWNLLHRTLPSLVRSFEFMGARDGALHKLYSTVPASNFSDDVLAACPAALSVLRADALGWSDLGEPQRVFSVRESTLGLMAASVVG